MQKYKKIILYIILVLLILISVLILSAPKLINLDSFKKTIINKLSDETGGEFTIGKIDFSFFPTFNIVVRNASFEIQNNNKISGTLDSISIYPKLIRLIKRKIEIKEIIINSPRVTVEINDSADTKRIKEEVELSLLEIFEQNIKDFTSLSSRFEGIILEINNGSLNIDKDGNSILGFSNIRSLYKSDGQIINVAINCNSDFSRVINLKANLNIHKSTGNGLIELKKAEPHKLTEYYYPGSPYNLEESDLDITIDLDSFTFSADIPKNVQGNIRGNLHNLKLVHGDHSLNVRGGNFIGNLNINEKENRVTIKELHLDNPKLEFNGELSMANSPKSVNLIIGGKNVDVSSVREASQSILGDISITQKIFEIVKGGYLDWIELKSKGFSIRELFKQKNYKIRGRMNNGEIFIPSVDWTLNDVSGDAEIYDGILKGENLEGRHRNTLAHNGKLKLGLSKNIDIFQLDIDVYGDIKDVPTYLSQFINNKKFLNEISLISDIKGDVDGRLVLGDKKSSIDVKFDASNFNLSANYQRIPYPVTIKEGSMSYEKSRIGTKNLSGNIGASMFSNLSSKFDWKDDLFLEIDSLKLNLSLDEFHTWLASFERLNPYLNRFEVESGVFNLSEFRFKGPPLKPADWEYRIKGNGNLINKLTTKFDVNLIYEQNEFIVNVFKLDDDYSKAKFKLKYKERLQDLEFKGNLNEKTLDNILVNNEYFNGYINGDIKLNLNEDTMSAIGKLEAQYSHCGILVKGNIEAVSQITKIDLKLNNEVEEISDTIECLRGEESPITGKYKFNVDIKSYGKGDNLKEFIQGSYRFNAKDGIISRKEGIFSKIFSILNISTLFKGKIGTLTDKNLTYSVINSVGDIQNGRFILSNAELYGASTGILANGYIDPINKSLDLRLKVTPLESVDTILRKIPLVKRFQTIKFLFIPIHIEGRFGDSQVKRTDK